MHETEIPGTLPVAEKKVKIQPRENPAIGLAKGDPATIWRVADEMVEDVEFGDLLETGKVDDPQFQTTVQMLHVLMRDLPGAKVAMRTDLTAPNAAGVRLDVVAKEIQSYVLSIGRLAAKA